MVEFAFPNEEAATYLFRMEEPWEAFLTLLNRALEATGLRREILSLPEERLHDEANADTRMAVIRTPAVRSLRARFTGRVIHRGLTPGEAALSSSWPRPPSRGGRVSSEVLRFLRRTAHYRGTVLRDLRGRTRLGGKENGILHVLRQ